MVKNTKKKLMPSDKVYKSYQFWLLVIILVLVFICMVFGILVYTRPQLDNKVEDEVGEVEEEVKEKSINDHASILFVSKEMFM
jgi:hypothetical protein